MFSTVVPLRLRCQLSSSVSRETMTSVSRMEPVLRQKVERPEPAAPPSRPEDHELPGGAPGPGPVRLVGVLAAQEVEPAVALLDGAADHDPHQHLAHALVLPAQGAAALVEVDRVVRGEPVPRRRGLALAVEGGEPEPAPLDRKSTRLNSSHPSISYAVFCLKKTTPSASTGWYTQGTCPPDAVSGPTFAVGSLYDNWNGTSAVVSATGSSSMEY